MVRCYTCKHYTYVVQFEKNIVTGGIKDIWHKYCQKKEQPIPDFFEDIQCDYYAPWEWVEND